MVIIMDLGPSAHNTAWMDGAYALQTNGDWMNYNGANNQEIFMFDNPTPSVTGDLLSAPFVWNNAVRFNILGTTGTESCRNRALLPAGSIFFQNVLTHPKQPSDCDNRIF